jgi:hypothetical protein
MQSLLQQLNPVHIFTWQLPVAAFVLLFHLSLLYKLDVCLELYVKCA